MTNPAAHSLGEKVSEKMDVTRPGAALSSPQTRLREAGRPIDWKKVDAIQKRIAALPALDSRTDDAILGYDGFGIPR